MSHREEVEYVFKRACEVLNLTGFEFKEMRIRRKAGEAKGNYAVGRTSLKNKTIIVDIYTSKLRKPKKISAILFIIAHELAHHQKPPFKQFFKGRIINRIHYPEFYKQVKKNIDVFKKDSILKKYFI